MSRAFVKEDNEADSFREQAEQEAKMKDWLRIQEKKLAVLLSKEKAAELDPELRSKWIARTREDIARTRKQLGLEDDSAC
ncbi:MAG: hypothetical protein U9R40_05470 [Synergistota bacterium]|nr:hypothetical protein [Synergistota bacterium]